MPRAEGLLSDRQSAFEERLGLRVGASLAASLDVQQSETVERDGGVGMLGAEHLLTDGEGPLLERFSLIVGAGGAVRPGEIAERGGGVGMLGAEYLLINRQSALEERFSLIVGAGGEVQLSEI